MLTPGATLEQIAIMRRLLDHHRMQGIPLRPPLPVLAIAIDNAREDRLRGIGGRAVRRARDLVQREGERDRAERDVEAALRGGAG